jgi:hypothetical protein
MELPNNLHFWRCDEREEGRLTMLQLVANVAGFSSSGCTSKDAKIKALRSLRKLLVIAADRFNRHASPRGNCQTGNGRKLRGFET